MVPGQRKGRPWEPNCQQVSVVAPGRLRLGVRTPISAEVRALVAVTDHDWFDSLRPQN